MSEEKKVLNYWYNWLILGTIIGITALLFVWLYSLQSMIGNAWHIENPRFDPEETHFLFMYIYITNAIIVCGSGFFTLTINSDKRLWWIPVLFNILLNFGINLALTYYFMNAYVGVGTMLYVLVSIVIKVRMLDSEDEEGYSVFLTKYIERLVDIHHKYREQISAYKSIISTFK